ncbi:MAG: hypothetical protein V1819_00180, partial [bacterium]
MKNLIVGFGLVLMVGLGVFGLTNPLEAADNCQTKCSSDGLGLQYCLSCDTANNNCLAWSSIYSCDSGYACQGGSCVQSSQTGQATVSLAPINITPGVTYNNFLVKVSANDSSYPGRINKICVKATDINVDQCHTCSNNTSCSFDFTILSVPTGSWRFYGLAYNSQNQELAKNSILITFNPLNIKPACTPQCTIMSAWQCPTTNTYKICGDFNNDSCLEWSSSYTCDTGSTCSATSKQCVAKNDNPTTANLSISKTSVLVGEKTNVSIQAQDTDGVEKVCLSDGDYQTPECFTGSSHTWEVSKSTPATYFFYGYAYGKKPNGETSQITTTPFFVTLTVKSQPTVCANQCQTMSAWSCPTTNTYQICGDFNNDSCLEWSSPYTCDSGYTCSAVGKTCQAVGDGPTTGTLTT